MNKHCTLHLKNQEVKKIVRNTYHNMYKHYTQIHHCLWSLRIAVQRGILLAFKCTYFKITKDDFEFHIAIGSL